MKFSGKGFLLLSSLLLGCDSALINGGYHDLGLFRTRVEAQNQAIENILKNYASLPQNTYYKIKYSFLNPATTPTAPDVKSEHALWYNKSETQLALEVDIRSGTVCRWTNATKTVLEQAIKGSDSMATVDSLGKPNQPIAQCK